MRLSDLKGLSVEARRAIRTVIRSVDGGGPSVLQALEGETPARSKWHDKKTVVDGITFDNEREVQNYSELLLEQQAGTISDLKLQEHFSLDVNGFHITDYVADFVYERDGKTIVEDVKSNPKDTSVLHQEKVDASDTPGVDGSGAARSRRDIWLADRGASARQSGALTIPHGTSDLEK